MPPPATHPNDPGPLPPQIKDAKDINVLLFADSDMLDDRFWVQVQDVLGQRVAVPSADNGALVMNAVENMMGSNDLISLRTRERSARPFVVVDHIRRDAEGRFLAEEQALQQRVTATEASLRQLQGNNQQSQAGAPGAQQGPAGPDRKIPPRSGADPQFACARCRPVCARMSNGSAICSRS